MRVSPRELKAVRASGLITRYAILGSAVFVIVDVPETGSAGTPIEDACLLEHWGLVLQGDLTVHGRTERTFGPGTAFYVRPGPPAHRLKMPGPGIIAGFAPVTEPIDLSPEAMRARGIEIVRRPPVLSAPPHTVRVEGTRSRRATVGQIETVSAEMGDWLFSRTSFGPLSGYTDGWCDLPHWGLVLDGDLVLRWEDGGLELLGPGDAFHATDGPPGHRLEVADVATIIDYTPVSAVDDTVHRKAPRAVIGRVRRGPSPRDPSPTGRRGASGSGATSQRLQPDTA